MPADFDLGEYVGVGLSTRQLAFAAGVLFFGLFAASAMRRAGRAGGVWAAVWGSAAVALAAVALYVAGRGLGDSLPEWLVPFTQPEPLQRAAAVGVLGCWAFIFLSAHWVNDSLLKWLFRVAGLGCLGVAAWLGATWFADDLPAEAKPWATTEIFLHVGGALGLLLLAAALWMKGRWGRPPARWAYRSLIPVVLGGLALMAYDRFAGHIPDDWKDFPARRVIVALTGIGSVCGLLIAAGAWLMRDRPPAAEPTGKSIAQKPKPKPAKPLPVAVLLDDAGRPILPPKKP